MQLWSEQDLDAMDQLAFEILEEVGIRVDAPDAREILVFAGCRLASDGRVRIPKDVALSATELCTTRFRLAARGPGRSLEVSPDPGETWVHNMSGAALVCDAATGERRPATCADQAGLARIMHQLRNLHLVCPMVQAQDVPAPLEPLYSYLLTVWETDKYVGAPGIEDGLQAGYIKEMSQLVVDPGDDGSGAAIDFYACSLSPLRLPAADTEKLLAMAGMNHSAMMIISAPTAGTTAPVTLPEAVAQQHAELLAGVVLLQAAAPGTPTTLGPRLNVADLRSGSIASGRYATGLASAAAVELARRHDLACDCYGLCTDSMVPDAQFGYERAINGLLGAAMHPRLLSGIGDMQCGMATNLEALIIDDDLLNDLLGAVETHQVDTEDLRAKVIAEGVSAPAGFLSLPHTRRHRPTPSITGRVTYGGGLDQWLREGSMDTSERAGAAVPELLAAPPVGLREDVLEGLCALIAHAARRMGVVDYPDPHRMVSET